MLGRFELRLVSDLLQLLGKSGFNMRKKTRYILLVSMHLPLLLCCITTKDRPRADSVPTSYVLNPIGATQYVAAYWKPHSFGLSRAPWEISFTDRVTMYLHNNASEFGHIACGSWWVPSFLNQRKLPLHNIKALTVAVEVYLSSARYHPTNARLRMAVASAISGTGAARLTEIDFWDSPALGSLLYPNGRRYFNGKDEYSYKTHQIATRQWIALTYNFLPYMKECWGDLTQASLECVYIVIESDCRDHRSEDIVSLDVRNLWINVQEF